MDWDQLHRIAIKEIEDTLTELPAPLREQARSVALIFERRPSEGLRNDGIEPDTLGLFVGPDFSTETISSAPLPPQIILFLENLWDEVAHDEDLFRDEVQTTFMHELGHYLGLDEDDLSDRGLE